MALADQVGSKVKELRERRGMTQSRLAEAAGMTSDEVSRIERGVREPRFGTLERLADALGVAVAELFSARASATYEHRPSYGSRLPLDELPPDAARVADQCARAVSRILSSYLKANRPKRPSRKPR